MSEAGPRVLVTGGSGRLGRALAKRFPGATMPRSAEMDVRDPASVAAAVKRIQPDLVLHTAAMTSIPACENDKAAAWRTNVEGTRNLVDALLAQAPRARLLQVSTACVFYGDRGMYTEEDAPHPKNYYAITKLAAEEAARRAPRWTIVRTNFVAREPWPYPRAFVDRFGTYLYAEDVAQGLADVAREEIDGVVHVVGDRKLSMYELAKMTTPDVQPLTLAEYKGPPVTIDMTLDTVRWKKYRIGAAG